MSDLISRQAAIDALEREKTYSTAYNDGYTQTDYFKQYNMGLTDGIKAIKNIPSAQPEIIYCKDCKNWDTDWQTIEGQHYCPMVDKQTNGEWFCADRIRNAEGEQT